MIRVQFHEACKHKKLAKPGQTCLEETGNQSKIHTEYSVATGSQLIVCLLNSIFCLTASWKWAQDSIWQIAKIDLKVVLNLIPKQIMVSENKVCYGGVQYLCLR